MDVCDELHKTKTILLNDQQQDKSITSNHSMKVSPVALKLISQSSIPRIQSGRLFISL